MYKKRPSAKKVSPDKKKSLLGYKRGKGIIVGEPKDHIFTFTHEIRDSRHKNKSGKTGWKKLGKS